MGTEQSGRNACPEGTPPRAKRWLGVLLFLYIWLTVGFAAGTLTLLGPTRWVTATLRAGRWAAYESYAMWAVIGVFIIASFLVARWLHGGCARSRRRLVRAGIPIGSTAAAAVALAGWSNPAALSGWAGGAEQELLVASGPEFVFGPYPDRQRLQRLKDEGFTAVISLQHPAVVPIEPPGIDAERKATAELGLEFIQAPMLPWISDNAEALATLRRVVETGHGKYYIHCGLGRDRVTVAKAFIERIGAARTDVTPEMTQARTFSDRALERRWLMERGNFQVLDDELWLVPWPNDKEGFGKLFGGQLKRVTVLMDPSDPEQAEWLAEARRLFGLYELPHEIVPHRVDDEASLISLAQRLRSGPRPAVVIVPRTAPCPRSVEADALLAAWERTTGIAAAEIRPGSGDPHAEGRPLPCETAPR